MYDIHCHVLHELDDGALDINESMLICRVEARDGVDTVIATPHFIEGESDIKPSSVLSKVVEVEGEAHRIGIDIKILPGMEVYITPDLAKLFGEGRIITLNNKNYMLIELPLFESIPPFLDKEIFELQLKGIKPIIAHPERCRDIMNHPNTVYRLIKNGCLMQINTGSIAGMFGKHAQQTAITLLNHNMVHAAGSDMHANRERIHGINECYKMVSDKFGSSTSNDLFINNPGKIINGEDIYIEEPEMIKKKKFWIF